MSRTKADKENDRRRPGPDPERLKIEGDWKEALRKILRKEKPPDAKASEGRELSEDPGKCAED